MSGQTLFPFSPEQVSRFMIAGKRWSEWEARYEEAEVLVSDFVWLADRDLSALQAAGPGAALWKDGVLLAQSRGGAEGCSAREITASEESFPVRYAWDLLRVSEQLVGRVRRTELRGTRCEGAHIEGQVELGEGSTLLPGVYIEGKVVIGKNCKIGPNCYLRGNTSIGDGCRIGQSVEIKNSLLGEGVRVGHLSYIGDSVLGDGVNLGAGTTTANLRHDGRNHLSQIEGELIDTGRRKFGAIFGEGVHTGINTSLYPGRKLGNGVTTLPGEIVKKEKESCAE